MPEKRKYPKYDVALSADELYLIDLAIQEKLEQLGRGRMVLLDADRLASYEAMVEKTVEFEMLLGKLRRKEKY